MASSMHSGGADSSSSNNNPITAETLGIVDRSEVDHDIWMIRIPPKLAAAFEKVPPGTPLGELVFRKGGSGTGGKGSKPIKPSVKVVVEESLGEEDGALPLEYTMEAMTKKVPVMHPFSRYDSTGQVKLHGTVSRTANLQASKTDLRYRQHRKNRLLQTSVNKKAYVKPVEGNELSVRKSMKNSAGFGSAVQKFGQRLKDAAANTSGSSSGVLGGSDSSSRKRKYEEKPTRSVLFELFQYQPRWTMKELRQESGKPESQLRQILGEIGTYHRTGEFKNMWSLKAEFGFALGGGGVGGGGKNPSSSK